MKKVIIAGSNAAAWLTAHSLRCQLGVDVIVVELKGACAHRRRAESLPPMAHSFRRSAQFNELDLIKRTNACFQLSTHYLNAAPFDPETKKSGYDFVHSFAPIGVDFDGLGFQHYFKKLGFEANNSFDDFSIGCQMAKNNKFVHPVSNGQSILSTLEYGLQVDTLAYTEYCKKAAKQSGVTNLMADSLTLNLDSWKIASIVLDNGLTFTADLYVDTTDDGLLHRMLLPKKSTQFSTPCSSVLRFTTPSNSEISTNTRIQAINSGILKSVPLADRIEHELFFNDSISNEDNVIAQAQILSGSSVISDTEFHALDYQVPETFWLGNCIALGENSGMPDPVCGGEIQLAQQAMTRIIELFPATDDHALFAQEYNRVTKLEYSRLNEFQLGLFNLTHQQDSDFWQASNEFPIPESLQHKLAVFLQSGNIAKYEQDPKPVSFWLSFLLGIGVSPKHYDPLLDMLDTAQAELKTKRILEIIQKTIGQLPSHREYLNHILQP